jgi:ElaA protein
VAADAFTLHTARGPEIAVAHLYAALRLRAQVFVVEQDCVYLDPDGRDLEAGTTHLWLTAGDGTLVAYVRLLTEPTGGHRIGRVVTDPAHRGARLAGRLIDHALTVTEPPVVLDAQSHLVHVYARHGFAPDGPEFLDDGIPHTPMRLTSPS